MDAVNNNESTYKADWNPNFREAEELTLQLVDSLGRKQKGWENIYLTLARVKDKQLYISLGLKSFTAYVNYLSKCADCQTSYIWRTWEAGKYYHDLTMSREGQQFRSKMEAAGKKIGDEVLSQVKKIAGNDTKRAFTILESFADGKITKNDIYQLSKSSKKHSLNDETNVPMEMYLEAKKNAPEAQKGPSRPDVKASDIFLALNEGDPFGLYDTWKEKSGKERFFLPKGHKSVYEVLAEFPVRVPGAAHSRRMDALVVTNLDAGAFGTDQHEITLRCVEIKVSEYDLKSDHKMGDYAPFVNRSYLAVPDYMEAFAADYILEGWGLLIYDTEEKRLRKSKEAVEYHPEFTFRTLQTLAVKKLKPRDFYGK